MYGSCDKCNCEYATYLHKQHVGEIGPSPYIYTRTYYKIKRTEHIPRVCVCRLGTPSLLRVATALHSSLRVFCHQTRHRSSTSTPQSKYRLTVQGLALPAVLLALAAAVFNVNGSMVSSGNRSAFRLCGSWWSWRRIDS